MQANPSKFQAIVFALQNKDADICHNIYDDKVEATKCVKQRVSILMKLYRFMSISFIYV